MLNHKITRHPKLRRGPLEMHSVAEESNIVSKHKKLPSLLRKATQGGEF